MDIIKQLKKIILENNYFDTLAGMRFKEWNNLNLFTGVISFSGRSKNQQSYALKKEDSDSDSDITFVTHLVLDNRGEMWGIIGHEDTDDFSVLLHPNLRHISYFDEETLKEWVDLLTF